MKVSHWQRKLSGVCQYLITQTGALYRSSMVEHAAVNRRVVGSSPTSGAIFYPTRQVSVIFAAELLP